MIGGTPATTINGEPLSNERFAASFVKEFQLKAMQVTG